MDTWLLMMCRKACIRQLVAWAVFFLFALILTTANYNYFINFVSGPYTMNSSDLEDIRDPTQATRYFVHVEGSKAIDTGIEEVRTKNGSEVSSKKFYVLDMGDKLLLVKNAAGIQTSIDGTIVKMPANFERKFFTSELSDIKDRFYPYMVDTESFRAGGYWTICFWICFVALFLWKGLPVWKQLQDLALHPVVRRFAHISHPIELAADIEKERKTDVRLTAGAWVFTSNYLIKQSFFEFQVFRFCDVLWAYKSVTHKRINFAPAGTDYHAIFVFREDEAKIPANEAQILELLRWSAVRAPWAMFGYDKKLEAMLKQHRDVLRSIIGERQREYCNL